MWWQRQTFAWLALLTWTLECVDSFQQASFVRKRSEASRMKAISNENEESSKVWMEELRAREHELNQHDQDLARFWRKANCSSAVAVHATDWLRRLDVAYPLVAFGTAREHVYVAHLETGEILASSQDDDDDEHENFSNQSQQRQAAPDNLGATVRLLYGGHDGGGTLAVAFKNNLVCEAPRHGGVNLWRLDLAQTRLVGQGSIQALNGALITCLHLEDDYLWVGRADGKVQAFELDDDMPLALHCKPEYEHDFASTVLSISIHSDLGCGVVTTAKGSVELISLEDDDTDSVHSFYPRSLDVSRGALPKANVYPLSATIARTGTRRKDYCIACGTSDGSLYIQPLAMTSYDDVDLDHPFVERPQELRPKHFGPINCLASPMPGLLISAGQDGTMRVWNLSEHVCMYQFIGYKVWLGSLWTDGTRIVSDGSDNTIILHDFSKTSQKR